MKKQLLITLTLLLATWSISFGQFTVGISPGLKLNSAQIGYKINRFVPFVSFQYLQISQEYIREGLNYNDNSEIVEETYSYKQSVGIYLPTIGVKYFFKEHEQLKAYGLLSIIKPIVSSSEEDSFGSDNEIIDPPNIWGGELGIGIEYFLSDNFSLGGEFGIKYFHFSSEENSNNELYDYNTGEIVSNPINEIWKYRANLTYSKVSFNYYF